MKKELQAKLDELNIPYSKRIGEKKLQELLNLHSVKETAEQLVEELKSVPDDVVEIPVEPTEPLMSVPEEAVGLTKRFEVDGVLYEKKFDAKGSTVSCKPVDKEV